MNSKATFWERVIIAALVGFALLYMHEGNAQVVRPTLELDSVRVEVYWSTREEITAARERFSPRGFFARERGARHADHTGFAVLGKRDGEDVCLLFVPRPTRVDDAATLVLGHELLHCLKGGYH